MPHSPTARTLLAALSLTAWLPGLAAAQDVVIYGPGTPDTDRAGVAEETYFALTDQAEAPPGGIASIFDLPFSSTEPLWMAGDLLLLPCSDSSLVEVDAQEVVKNGMKLIDGLDYEKGLLALKQGLDALPCSKHDISRTTLTKLHFYLGIGNAEIGNERKTRRSFSAALSINIEAPWDTNFAPHLEAIWNEARQDLLDRGRVSIKLDTRGTKITTVEVDGSEVPLESVSELLLQPGLHLIRYRDDQGARHGSLVDVSGSGGAIVSRAALNSAVLGMDQAPEVHPAASLALKSLLRDRAAKTAFIVVLDDDNRPERTFRWSLEDGSVSVLELDDSSRARIMKALGRRSRTQARLSAERGPAEPGRFGLFAGGGLLLNSSYAMPAITARIDVRLVKGLEASAGTVVGFSEAGQLPVVLPLVSLDLRYRFLRGPAHLCLGVRGLLGFTNSETDLTDTELYTVGGVAGVVGLELTPQGDKGLTIHVDVGGGVLGQSAPASPPRFHLTATGGVGFRL